MWKRFKESGYFKSLAILASGSLIGAAFTAIAEIARTWIFPAEQIGIFTFLLAFPLMFISIPTLRYDISIIVEKEDRKTLAIVKLNFILLCISSLLLSVGYALFIFVFHSDYAHYWYTIPFAFFVVSGYGINNILNAYNNRNKEYKEISQKYVVRSLVQGGVALILGVLIVLLLNMPQWSVLIMYAPYGLGLFVGAWKQSRGIRARFDELKSITYAEVWEAAKYHRRQAYFSTPALFVNSYSYTSITLLIEELFDTTILAYYSISNRVLGMPIALISGNVAKVYIEEAAKEYNETGRFVKSFRKSFFFLAAIAIPMFFIMYFLAPPICELLLGEGWFIAGEYIRILALMFSFRLVGTALSQSLAVCNRQGIELIVNIGLVVATFLCGILVKKYNGDIYYFLKCICVSRSACYIGLIIAVYICSLGRHSKKET